MNKFGPETRLVFIKYVNLFIYLFTRLEAAAVLGCTTRGRNRDISIRVWPRTLFQHMDRRSARIFSSPLTSTTTHLPFLANCFIIATTRSENE